MHSLCLYHNNTHQFVLLIEHFDAVCCVLCNEWIEQRCSDPTCEFCSIRPKNPMTEIQYEHLNELIFAYSKKHAIPPMIQDQQQWDLLYEKIESFLNR